MKHEQSNGRPLERTKTPGIYKRGGSYCVIVRDASGRSMKKAARTLAEARTIKASVKTDVARGEYRPASKLTLAEYAPEWLDGYTGRTSRGIRPETLKAYRAELARATPVLGGLRLTEIEARHLKAYAAQLSASGLSRNSVRLALAPIKALLGDGFDEGLLRWNPAAGLRLTQPEPESQEGEKVKALTPEDLRALLLEIPEHWRLLPELLAATGLRIGEALALQWAHVDFGRRRVLVRRRWYRGAFAAPKSRFGRRDVPLTPVMAQRLWEVRKQSDRAGAIEEALVFPSGAGTPLNVANFYGRVYKPAAARAGVPWATLHTLRHTCATALFREGKNPKQVQVWLGHHSAAFTLDTYVHLLPDDLGDAPASFDVLRERDDLAAAGDGAQAEPAPLSVSRSESSR